VKTAAAVVISVRLFMEFLLSVRAFGPLQRESGP